VPVIEPVIEPVVGPRVSRVVTGSFAAVAGADLLQLVRTAAQQVAE
jgi:hypothetical protein